MILRRDLITMLGGAAIAWPLAVRAQEKGRTYRIGILSLSPRLFGFNAFYVALGRLGFVEGQNLQVDAAGYGLQPEQLAQHAAELVRAKVDVIFGNGGGRPPFAPPSRRLCTKTRKIGPLFVQPMILHKNLRYPPLRVLFCSTYFNECRITIGSLDSCDATRHSH